MTRFLFYLLAKPFVQGRAGVLRPLRGLCTQRPGTWHARAAARGVCMLRNACCCHRACARRECSSSAFESESENSLNMNM